MSQHSSSSDDFLHDDVHVGKAFDRHLMARLLRYAAPYKLRILGTLALILVVTALSIVGPFIGQIAIDGPLATSIRAEASTPEESAANFRQLLFLGGVFVATSVALIVFRFIQAYSMAKIGQLVMLDLRMELFRHLQRLPLSFYDRNPVGRLVTRITSDIEALNELLASGVVTFVADVLILIGIAVALVMKNVQLALVTLAVVPFLLLATFIFRSKARDYYRDQRRHLSQLNAYTQESIQGMNVIQLFDRQEAAAQRYSDINQRYLTTFLRTVNAYALYFPSVELLSTLTLVAIIWMGGGMIDAGSLSWGEFYLFWVFLGRFFQPIRDMAERYNILQSAMAAAERVFGILDTQPGMKRSPSDDALPKKLSGRVRFENVWFAYRDDDFVLRDISFDVAPGEVVAIVGATGAGKSTIVNLLTRLYDVQRGSISLDGFDVRAYSKRDLRRRIGIVLQDVFLFSRSVRDNIRLGNEAITDADIESAAVHVNAQRFIERLPAGYEHVLAERGGELSVGEKQLLSFARVLAHGPDFLVLDEATANVDTETEVLIQDALEKVLENRTAIVIAHRLSTIRRADRIVVLHKGEIRESGRHADLMARGGIYARLYELQYRK